MSIVHGIGATDDKPYPVPLEQGGTVRRVPVALLSASGTVIEPMAVDDSVIYIAGVAYAVKRAVIHHNTNGDNTIVAAVPGKKICVVKYTVVVAGATTVRWESGAGGTALTGQMSLAANGGIAEPPTPWGIFETAAGELLNLELSAAVYADGVVNYIEV